MLFLGDFEEILLMKEKKLTVHKAERRYEYKREIAVDCSKERKRVEIKKVYKSYFLKTTQLGESEIKEDFSKIFEEDPEMYRRARESRGKQSEAGKKTIFVNIRNGKLRIEENTYHKGCRVVLVDRIKNKTNTGMIVGINKEKRIEIKIRLDTNESKNISLCQFERGDMSLEKEKGA
ncbi:MAG: uncharacterized protein A8A55_1696 [Amphiamblys sp. WSBS2006]|nr:MAG: uncharacterized protein A8A55_1696 [Amphiamblys sp. WSBS2006]